VHFWGKKRGIWPSKADFSVFTFLVLMSSNIAESRSFVRVLAGDLAKYSDWLSLAVELSNWL